VRRVTEPDAGGGRRDDRARDAVEIIVPNLSFRYSGVTATNRMIAPRLQRHGNVAWLGRDRPDGVARLTWLGLLRLRAHAPRRRPFRIWHARRNVDMLLGMLLRRLGWRLGLVFTSAAQRRHKITTRWMIRAMDAVIAASAESAGFLDVPARIVHHGIDTERYRPPPDRAAAWAAGGLPGRYGIGCFGRVREQKGTDVFVAAMCRLLPRYPDFTAVVIGEVIPTQQAFMRRLKADVAAAGLSERVVFLDYLPIDAVPEWHRRVSIYAFTSRREGFGLTLLEAMASGAAVVAARAGAAEIVVADGESGLLVPPGDVEATAAALEALMRDTARAAAMGVRARERVVAAFSIDAEADAIAGVYGEIWERAGPRGRRGADRL
jgi:mannosyltransferase